MTTIDVELIDESQTRYITYALSVVNSRALPDVRDGLKPVQRRILYAMVENLRLTPDHHHRKSAAVVGEVLARYHPHGDTACYEAMVRMAQDFSYRYPLVDGQGNFGSLDGDGAAAYRYTEARLTPFALEVIGDIGQETVAERPNFDQTILEPVVLPSRVPNLLVNGASGIAVGMATAIPPHNLREVTKALITLVEEPDATDGKILSSIKGPDFPTGCLILNTPAEMKEIYKTGRGPIRMRASYKLEPGSRGKEFIVVDSIPYGTDKSVIVEKIADLILNRKVPQLNDVRDESTDIIRVVLELAQGADPEKAMAYLFKHTLLQTNFNVNLTALTPSANPLSGKPVLLSLRQMLDHFATFRIEVTRAKLTFERKKLSERIHLLKGLVKIIDYLKEAIDIVRKSEGRADAATKLMKTFKLTEVQAYFVVDLRIYQLSRTNVEEVRTELKEKEARVEEIDAILKSDKKLRKVVATDLERISNEYGDARRSKIVSEFEEAHVDEEEYVQHEDVFVVVTKDGWLKRIRTTNDPSTTRVREGDALFFTGQASTRDSLALVTNFGNLFVVKVFEVASTSGFGEPVQKMFRFQDGETIISAFVAEAKEESKPEMLVFGTEGGLGFRMEMSLTDETKKNGKRVAKVKEGDALVCAARATGTDIVLISRDGYVVRTPLKDIPVLSSAGKGVILQKLPRGDKLVVLKPANKNDKILVEVAKGNPKELLVSEMEIMERARRGLKLVSRNLPVMGLVSEAPQKQELGKPENGSRG